MMNSSESTADLIAVTTETSAVVVKDPVEVLLVGSSLMIYGLISLALFSVALWVGYTIEHYKPSNYGK